jgi:hypothetical protein
MTEVAHTCEVREGFRIVEDGDDPSANLRMRSVAHSLVTETRTGTPFEICLSVQTINGAYKHPGPFIGLILSKKP